MRYMIFAENADYTDESGETCSLYEHLSELRKWSGTPDSVENFDSLSAAKSVCMREMRTVLVIDEHADYRPVYRSKYEPETINFKPRAIA